MEIMITHGIQISIVLIIIMMFSHLRSLTLEQKYIAYLLIVIEGILTKTIMIDMTQRGYPILIGYLATMLYAGWSFHRTRDLDIKNLILMIAATITGIWDFFTIMILYK